MIFKPVLFQHNSIIFHLVRLNIVLQEAAHVTPLFPNVDYLQRTE